MWGVRAALPLVRFLFERLQRRQPGLHHLLADVQSLAETAAAANLALVDPLRFAAEKRYMLVTLERGA
jgi:hypothetical protein